VHERTDRFQREFGEVERMQEALAVSGINAQAALTSVNGACARPF
jgi:hypothetical protein